ncbi:MAG: nickel ABC transporter permease subunit NikC, partial [Dialister sp.]|nr:nickel ABC transporter permease subunit NikC [Dialister sp.]
MNISFSKMPRSMWWLSGLIVLVILFSLVSPSLTPYDPYLTDSGNILTPPGADHLFGTDNHGRDILSRVMV